MNALFLAVFLLLVAPDEAPRITGAAKNEHGLLIHEVESPYQEGRTQIRVLLPDALNPNHTYPAIYVLPVEAKNESRYGDGLLEVKKHGLQNKHNAIFIAPTFFHLPWYADHPTNLHIRQETYFLNVVIPYVEKTHPVQATPEGRLLLGFSKSGWGAWSLLLRHSNRFGRAAAWDAPLMMDRLGKYGTLPIFGTDDNFAEYQISELLRTNAKSLGPQPRLILTGYGNFRPEHEAARTLLNDLKIQHTYRDGPERKHDWHSGWVPEAVALLLSGAELSK